MIRETTMLSRTMLRKLAGENLRAILTSICEQRDATLQFLFVPFDLIGH